MDDETPDAAPAPAKKSGGKGMAAFAVGALLLLASAVTVGVMAFPQAGGAVHEEKDVKVEDLPRVQLPVPQLLVNLADSNGRRLLQSTWTVEIATAHETESVAKFTRWLPKVQDQMIKVLSSYRVDELDGGANKEFLQVRLKDHLNATVFADLDEEVTNMFVTEFVIQ